MVVRHFLSMLDWSSEELLNLVKRAIELKSLHKQDILFEPLKNRVLGMIFEKASTRTRISFEAGMIQLGGKSIFLTPQDTQLGRGEPICDSSKVISSMLDAIMIRTFEHSKLEEFAKYSSKPVINALTDKLHPCQVLADMQTFYELRGSIEGKTVTWIGDGNNMCNSYIEASIRFNFSLNIATPKGYEPDSSLLELAKDRVTLTNDVKSAAHKSHLITTDVFTSMGQEQEKEKRLKDFVDFQVNKDILDLADDSVLFLHCLPAHRGEEISEGTLDDPRSAVFLQAENRLHAQKSLLELLIKRTFKYS